MENSWQGKRILMLGAGRQGQALARYMADRKAIVTISDIQPFDQLRSAWESLKMLPIRWVTGGHPQSLLDETDFVCVTGGADLKQPILKEAFERGLPVLNDTQIFLTEVSAPVIGITGSSGKTTTTTLVGRIAEAAKKPDQKVWVGGNIGMPLLTMTDKIQPDDIVILELSSFQLELTTVSPHIAAVLNITPNHLDRHETMEAYIRAKKNILNYQSADDIAVLNRDDENSWHLRNDLKGKIISFGFDKPAENNGDPVIYCENMAIKREMNGEIENLIRLDQIRLRGRHNIANTMAAFAVSTAAGFGIEAMRSAVVNFTGVEHRLQYIRNFHGADWYNDSIATAPERTLAAVRSFDEPLVMLLGGRDKKLPWDELATEIHHHAHAAILFGEAAPLIKKALERNKTSESELEIIQVDSLEEAVDAAASVCREGDVVLLSPGGTSYDAFRDFEERGKAFTEWVMRLT